MRLKLDENLPESAVPRLAALGFDVDTVLGEKLGGHSDTDVWAPAPTTRGAERKSLCGVDPAGNTDWCGC